jgi:ring-1,2-phenylacetyl-CoA epoxidase subunit PaaE
MAKFHSLPVVNKKQETPDAIAISFGVPDHLKMDYAYQAGQYLTLRMEIDGEEVRRAYSLCSSPLEDEVLTVAVKKVEGGKMSTWLNERLQIGLSIDVMVPEGRFVPALDAHQAKHYILIAGGSGITPMMSILRTVLKAEPQCKVTLVYANRDPNAIIFKSQLEDLQAQYGHRFGAFYWVDDAQGLAWQGGVGRLDASVVQTIFTQHVQAKLQEASIFLCGPAPMMEGVVQGMGLLGVAADKIQIEYFSAPVAAPKSVEEKTVQAPAKGSKVFVTLYGKEYELHIEDKTTILQAGVKAGIDPPFSCEAGICSTCMARVLEGAANMDENNILTKDEVAQGYILTCQAHPTTPIVRLEYYD